MHEHDVSRAAREVRERLVSNRTEMRRRRRPKEKALKPSLSAELQRRLAVVPIRITVRKTSSRSGPRVRPRIWLQTAGSRSVTPN